MYGGGTTTFTDPQMYQVAVRPAEVEILVSKKGDFHAELTRLEMPQLWLQSAEENLPRVARISTNTTRTPIFFLSDENQPATRHSGMDASFGDIIAVAAGSGHHVQTNGPSRWATLSLPAEDLAAASYALLGRALTVPSVTHRMRPSAPLMARLLALHKSATKVAAAGGELRPETARALDQSLIHAMIACLADGAPVERTLSARLHAAIISRFEELLTMNHDRPLYLAEICAATGASERTLRVCCQEHLGMSPVRYLWLRRMHFAHNALLLAAPATKTVTDIALDHGFWELGRFSVQYRALFGEAPLASLHRPAEGRRKASAVH